MNDLKKLKKQIQQSKTYFALIAAYHFNKAVLASQCAKPSTFQEAKFTSDMINFFFKKETTPYEFMRSVEERVNESIKSYQEYQKAVSLCPFEKQALSSFAHWYSYSGFQSAMLKCNIGYIIHFGLTILEHKGGMITETEMLDTFERIISAGEDMFTFCPRLVKQTFLKAVVKFEEIESKVFSRN